MLIELEEPFRSQWKSGYLRADPESGRKYISLYNHSGDQKSMAYARYLVSVKLGEVVSDNFEVDHIDDDCTNDSIDNLQLLTQQQNLEKKNLRYRYEVQYSYVCCCAYCDSSFLITEREHKKRLHCNPEALAFCSHPCSHNYNSDKRLEKNGKLIPDSLARQLQSYRDIVIDRGI